MRSINLKNVAVFPYGYEFTPILSGLLAQGKIDKTVKLVSPSGWGICGLDAGEAFGYPEIGIKILHDFEKAIDGCSVYIIAPFELTIDEKVNEAINSMINKYSVLASKRGMEIIDLRIKPDIDYSFLLDISLEEINIDVPVVFVSGFIEKVNKLDVTAKLSNSLAEKGYKICTIGTRYYSDIIDMHPFPQFMFDPINDEKKIEMFRSFIYFIQEKEHPDVIIIGIPGASLPINEYVPMGYGITNYLTSMAIRPDFSIVCAYYNPFIEENICNIYKYRYNQKIDYFYISPTKIIYDFIQVKYSVDYEHLNYKTLKNRTVGDSNISEIPSYSLEESDKIIAYLVGYLGSSECITVI